MRVVNNTTGDEFYLSRIKNNIQPKYTHRIRPVQITINKEEYDLYCNPRRSQYAYINLIPFDGWWYACRQLDILKCTGDPLEIIDFGRPFKERGGNENGK